MRLIAIQGKNFKNYIKIVMETPRDVEILEEIRTVVSRSEYKPFIKSFNKNISESYLIEETFIPAQLWADVYKRVIRYYPEIKIENDAFLYSTIKKQDVLEYAETLVLPSKFDIFKDEYFYQLESVYRALLFKQARIEISTGGGKTMVTYLFMRYLVDNVIPKDRKLLLVINRKDLVKQTALSFKEYDQFNDKPLIVETVFSGAKKVADANIVIGTYQTLCNYDKEYFDDFSVLVCDEAHSAKAYSIRNEIYSKCFNCEYLLGMTGTWPKYETLDYLNLASMFGPIVFTKGTQELIADGNICPVFINKIIIDYTDENKYFSQNLVDSGIVGAEKYRIEKVFFQNYEPRTQLIAKLINGYKENHLILVESVEYCEYLKEFIQQACPDRFVNIIHGKVPDKQRDFIKQQMELRDDCVTIATYETMSTGVSINNIHYVHFPNGGRSEFRVKQGTGRGVRLHPKKEFLNVFDYQDNMPRCAFKNHSRERNKIYEAEGHPSKEFRITI